MEKHLPDFVFLLVTFTLIISIIIMWVVSLINAARTGQTAWLILVLFIPIFAIAYIVCGWESVDKDSRPRRNINRRDYNRRPRR